MQKQLDITRTVLHVLMTKPTILTYIIRPVFFDRLSRNVANENAFTPILTIYWLFSMNLANDMIAASTRKFQITTSICMYKI